MRDGPYKYISVVKLRELLDQLPDDWLLNCQSVANTGNLSAYRTVEEELVAWVDFGTEVVEVIDERTEK